MLEKQQPTVDPEYVMYSHCCLEKVVLTLELSKRYTIIHNRRSSTSRRRTIRKA